MVLEEPGLGKSLAAGFEEGAQFDRVRAVDDEVELDAPVAGDAVWHRLDQLIGAKSPARGRDHEFGLHPIGQARERRAQKLDEKLAHALRPRLTRLPAAAKPGR